MTVEIGQWFCIGDEHWVCVGPDGECLRFGLASFRGTGQIAKSCLVEVVPIWLLVLRRCHRADVRSLPVGCWFEHAAGRPALMLNDQAIVFDPVQILPVSDIVNVLDVQIRPDPIGWSGRFWNWCFRITALR